jgi:hypothetical protein
MTALNCVLGPAAENAAGRRAKNDQRDSNISVLTYTYRPL